jgi:glycosyltransferase involved in cell wall biosynthesis
MYAEYSPRNGNAVSTVVHELCVASEALGRRSVVLVSEDRRHDYPDELVVADLGHPPGRQFRSRLARRFDEAVTTAVPIRPPAASRFYRCIADALGLTTGPVVVHNDPDLARVIRSLARDRRVYLHCHNELFTRRTRRSARATVRDVHGVICVSDFVARGVRKRTGDVARTIHVVRNGVDPSRFSPAAARRAGPPRILFVGKVVPHKGAHLLIDACVELASVEGRSRWRSSGAATSTM